MVDPIVKAGSAFVQKEGWLGFVMIAASLLLAWYVWKSDQQTERIISVLLSSHELQRETLEDRSRKTAAIEKNTQVLNVLAQSNDETAQNLNHLVQVVKLRMEMDAELDAELKESFRKLATAIREVSESSKHKVKALQVLIENGEKKK